MKKLIGSMLAVALLATGCGGSADDNPTAARSDSGGGSLSVPDAGEVMTDEPVASTDDSGVASVPSGSEETVTDSTPVSEPVSESIAPAESAGEGTSDMPESVVSHPNPNVAVAMTDLVDRFGVDPASIVVKRVEEVTWPDGSIGCPLPDMRYTQALVNGTRILLEVGGSTYSYHSGGGREPFFCAKPSDPVPGDYGDA